MTTMSIMCFPIFTKLVFDRINNAVYIKYIFPVKKDKFITILENVRNASYCGNGYHGECHICLIGNSFVQIDEYSYYTASKWIANIIIQKINNFLANKNCALCKISLVSNSLEWGWGIFTRNNIDVINPF